MKLNISDAGYLGRSSAFAGQRCVNFYSELGKDAKTPVALIGTPGTALFSNTGAGVIRGSHAFNGVLYIVSGSGLYSVDNAGTESALLGTLSTSSGRVVMSDNGLFPTGGNQLFITDGSFAYVYTVSATVFTVNTFSNMPLALGGGTSFSPPAYNGSVYVVIWSGANTVLTSPDGINWTKQTQALNRNWVSVAWNGTLFCAIASGSVDTITSPDGINWTHTVGGMLVAAAWTSITSLAGVFRAVASGGVISEESTDGSGWASNPLPGVANWSYVNGTIAISSGSTSAATFSGGTWHASTMPSSALWRSGAFNSNSSIFVAVGDKYAAVYNGAWSGPYTIPGFAVNAKPSIAWNGKVWMAINTLTTASYPEAATSPDGINWTAVTMPASSTNITWEFIAAFSDNSYFFGITDFTPYTGFPVTFQTFSTLYGTAFDGSKLIKVSGTGSFLLPTSCFSNTFINGYFVIDIGGGQWAVSNLYDGTRFNALNNSTADASPDNLLAVFSNHGELWLFGEYTTEIWYLTGQSSPLFARMPGGVLDYGIVARYSLSKGNNTLFWLANIRDDNAGEFYGVVMANGYAAQKISTPAIDYQISTYSTISDAWAYIYTDGGHDFYRITFPTANATWQFDITTGIWNEVSAYQGSLYATGRHIGNTYSCAFGKHLLGSYLDGKIYQMAQSLLDDAGTAISSFKIMPYVVDSDSLNEAFISKFQVDAETGRYSVGGVAASIATQDGPQGICVDSNGFIWVSIYGLFPPGNKVQKIDPVTSSIVATVTLSGVQNGPYGLCFENGFVWAADYITGKISKIDINTNTFIKHIAAPGVTGIDYDGIRYIWAIDINGNNVYQLDTTTDSIIQTIAVTGTNGPFLSCGGGKIWFTTGNSIGMIDPSNAYAVTYYVLGAGLTLYGIQYYNGYVWVADNATPKLFRMKVSDSSVTSIPCASAYAVRVGFNSILVTNLASQTVSVVDPVSFSIMNTIATGINPQDVAYSNGFIYIVNHNSNTVTQIYNFPKIILSWSDDSGNTWSTDHEVSLGEYQAYSQRAIWRRLGKSRGRLFRVAIKDPIKKVLIGANIEVLKGRG